MFLAYDPETTPPVTLEDGVVLRLASPKEAACRGFSQDDDDLRCWVFEIPGKGHITTDARLGHKTHWILSMNTDKRYRRQGVNRTLFRALCRHADYIIPGVVVAMCAQDLVKMMLREAAAAGVRVGDYRIDPYPESE